MEEEIGIDEKTGIASQTEKSKKEIKEIVSRIKGWAVESVCPNGLTVLGQNISPQRGIYSVDSTGNESTSGGPLDMKKFPEKETGGYFFNTLSNGISQVEQKTELGQKIKDKLESVYAKKIIKGDEEEEYIQVVFFHNASEGSTESLKVRYRCQPFKSFFRLDKVDADLVFDIFKNSPDNVEFFINQVFPQLKSEIERFTPTGVYLIDGDEPELLNFTESLVDNWVLQEWDEFLKKYHYIYPASSIK